ncbi:hypothetical protein SteCoe_13505 [Stentor coeruleus]|uniref:RING-type domain-containing protein n=1 Tax=Stentor coeruleus TaxID=5963 RepID=A0A1R2C858_9CILI|nr:hypothetical protein SteCoe_13505 [Stentor coeruleus]
MDSYHYKSIICTKCNHKILVSSSPNAKCPNCEHLINSHENTKRTQSEKKTKKPLHEHKTELKKNKKPEEEKKSIKKPLADKAKKTIKKPTKEINSPTRSKAKDPAPQKKRGKKKPPEGPKPRKIPLRQAHPTQRQYQEFYSDSNDFFEDDFFSDSFERENSQDFPVIGFNPVYLPNPGYFMDEIFERPVLNRVSHNLFNLFFDNIPGFSEVEFTPIGGFRSESRTFSIAEILSHLVSMHPERSTPANPVVVSQIPTITMSQSLLRDNPTCTICQEEFRVGEMLKKLRCGHIYHGDCLMPWFQAKDTCPVCREAFNA